MPFDEDGLLNQLEPDIRRLARHWSRDAASDVWEDVAQVARLAIVLELRKNPDSPRTHLFAQAKHRVLDYRKRGKSVDGRLNHRYKRDFRWHLVSLDGELAPLRDEGPSPYFRPWQENPVEALVLARVMYSELQARLSETEARYLSLTLQGYPPRKVAGLLKLSQCRGQEVRVSIEGKAREIFLLE